MIHICVEGPAASGKTAVRALIGKALDDLGIDVSFQAADVSLGHMLQIPKKLDAATEVLRERYKKGGGMSVLVTEFRTTRRPVDLDAE